MPRAYTVMCINVCGTQSRATLPLQTQYIHKGAYTQGKGAHYDEGNIQEKSSFQISKKNYHLTKGGQPCTLSTIHPSD